MWVCFLVLHPKSFWSSWPLLRALLPHGRSYKKINVVYMCSICRCTRSRMKKGMQGSCPGITWSSREIRGCQLGQCPMVGLVSFKEVEGSKRRNHGFEAEFSPLLRWKVYFEGLLNHSRSHASVYWYSSNQPLNHLITLRLVLLWFLIGQHTQSRHHGIVNWWLL